MSQDIVIRSYNKGDEDHIVSLLVSVFNGWPHFDLNCSPTEHWIWKYVDNPLRMKVISVAESKQQIIGCSHGYYLKVKLGKKSMLAQQGTDLAVHKNFRGLGIYPKMTKLKDTAHKENNANISYTISGNSSVIKNDLKNNRSQFPSPIKHMLKIKDVNKHFINNKYKNNLIKKYVYFIVKFYNHLINSFNSFNNNIVDVNFKISEVKMVNVSFEIFWNEIKDNYNFIIERNSAYLHWRYFDQRGGKYIVKQAVEDNRVLGYIVLRINKYNRNYSEGYIVDLLTLPNRIDVADVLVRDAEQFFTENEVNVVHALAIKGHPYERLFERHNFLNDMQRHILFYTPLNVGEDLKNFVFSPSSKLHFVYGDLDWI